MGRVRLSCTGFSFAGNFTHILNKSFEFVNGFSQKLIFSKKPDCNRQLFSGCVRIVGICLRAIYKGLLYLKSQRLSLTETGKLLGHQI